MYTPTFAELAGDEEVFFSTYFNRQPLLRPGALAGRCSEVLSFAHLDEILQTEALRPPYIRVFQNKNAVHPDGYIRSLGVQGTQIPDSVDPQAVMRLFDAGATITWNALNHFRPNLRALSADLATRFSTRVDIMSFLAKPAVQGFRPHYDPVDLFIVQLEGTKRWTVWPTVEERPGGSRSFTSPDQLGAPLWQASLAPGDVLYLPFNTPHAVMSEDAVSLHMSVMIRPRRWEDLLQETVQELLSADREFGDFPFLGGEHDLAAEFRQKADRLAKLLTAADPEAALTAYRADQSVRVGSASEPLLSDYVRGLQAN